MEVLLSPSGSAADKSAPVGDDRPQPPRLFVADPSLLDARGHHFTLSLQITRGAIANGMSVGWLTHRDFDPRSAPAGVAVHGVFSATMYDRYRPQTKGQLTEEPERQLLRELQDGVAAAGLTAADHVYFHTGFGDLFRALVLLAQQPDVYAGPMLHVCTPYDHDTMPGKDPGPALDTALRTLRTLPAVDRRLFLWAETPQLAQHYTATYGVNMRPMPLPPPAGAAAGWASDAGREPDNDAPVTALYLGAAREEKGFLHLPALAEQLFESHGRRGALRFVIQCTPQIIGYLPSIKQAIERLAALPPDYVQLIRAPLGEDDYAAAMQACDIVVLLYNRKSYRIRGSGIAVEAVSAGKALLTTQGTFCASLLTHGGGAAVDDAQAASDLLATMVDDIQGLRERASRQGAHYRAQHDATRYVQRILARASPALCSPIFPSALIGHVAHPLLRAR